MIQVTGIPLRSQQPLPPMPMTGLNDVNGFTRFYIGVNLSMDEVKEWSPQRITQFFEGIAKVIGARGKPTR